MAEGTNNHGNSTFNPLHNMTEQERSDELVEEIKALLSERAINYAFVILDDQQDLRYDYSNWRVGKMLFADSLIDMSQEMMMLDSAIWGEVEDEDEEEEED